MTPFLLTQHAQGPLTDTSLPPKCCCAVRYQPPRVRFRFCSAPGKGTPSAQILAVDFVSEDKLRWEEFRRRPAHQLHAGKHTSDDVSIRKTDRLPRAVLHRRQTRRAQIRSDIRTPWRRNGIRLGGETLVRTPLLLRRRPNWLWIISKLSPTPLLKH